MRRLVAALSAACLCVSVYSTGMAHDLSGGTTCGTILKYNAGHGAKRMNPVSKRYCGKVQSIID